MGMNLVWGRVLARFFCGNQANADKWKGVTERRGHVAISEVGISQC